MITKLLSLTAPDLRALMREADEQGFSRAVKQKLQWFLFAVEHKHNISLTCRHFAITRSTFQRWLERFDAKDLSSLDEKSRRPNKVRLPETSADIVALIRMYREQNATMGKELIRKMLQEEHNIQISASTIGRVISRNHFYFSQQQSHQMKLRAWAITTEEATEKKIHQLTQELHDLQKPKDSEQSGGSTWFGPGLSAILLLIGVGASLGLMPGTAHADTSPSFILLPSTPSEGLPSPHTAPDYRQESGISWYQQNADSQSFKVVGNLPAYQSAASSAAASSAGATSSAASSIKPSGTPNGSPPPPSIQPKPPVGPGVPGQPGQPGQPLQPRPPLNNQVPGAPSWLGGPLNPQQPGQIVKPSIPVFVNGKVNPAAKPPSTVLGKKLLTHSETRMVKRLRQEKLKSAAPKAQSTNTNKATPSRSGRQISIARSLLAIGSAIPHALPEIVVVLVLILAILIAALRRRMQTKAVSKKKTKRTAVKRKKHASAKRTGAQLLVLLVMCSTFLSMAPKASAVVTTPPVRIYKGYLLTSSGQPVTTPVSMRFSYWKSADFVDGDLTGTGAINTSAANYLGWREMQTVTPDSKGAFTVNLGATSALPDLSLLPSAVLLSLFIQVEVKAVGAPNTDLELLDTNPTDPAVDRSQISSVPFARNADYLDQRDAGLAAGNIPYLDGAAQLAKSAIPGGTNANFFTIDDDASVASGTIDLLFGSGLNKKLSYDITNNRFNFNSNLRVQGDLTITGSLIVNGTINGIDLTSLTPAQSQLQVLSGAGLNANITGGNYRVNGDVTNFAGQSNVSLQNNTDNYLFFTSTGLTLSTAGFPADKSFIPLAKVTTAGGAISSVVDRRVLMSDDREQTMLWVMHPDFSDAAYQADGTSNVGQLSVANDNATGKNYYSWTTTRTSLQDYDIAVRVTLPKDFSHWTATPMKLNYKTATGNNTQNKVDVTILDTAGSSVTLNAATGLASAGWAEANMSFQGNPTWTAGETIIIKLKLSSTDVGQVQVGDLELNYVELH